MGRRASRTGRELCCAAGAWLSCTADAPDARRELWSWLFGTADPRSAQREPCIGGPFQREVDVYKPRLVEREPKPAPLMCQRHQPKP